MIYNRLVSPRSANDEELSLFHSKDYIECLRTLSECEDEEKYDEDAEVFGLSKFTSKDLHTVLQINF